MIRFEIDPGGEYLLGPAKQRLALLRGLRNQLGVVALQRVYVMPTGEVMYIRTHNCGGRDDPDIETIRITAGESDLIRIWTVAGLTLVVFTGYGATIGDDQSLVDVSALPFYKSATRFTANPLSSNVSLVQKLITRAVKSNNGDVAYRVANRYLMNSLYCVVRQSEETGFAKIVPFNHFTVYALSMTDAGELVALCAGNQNGIPLTDDGGVLTDSTVTVPPTSVGTSTDPAHYSYESIPYRFYVFRVADMLAGQTFNGSWSNAPTQDVTVLGMTFHFDITHDVPGSAGSFSGTVTSEPSTNDNSIYYLSGPYTGKRNADGTYKVNWTAQLYAYSVQGIDTLTQRLVRKGVPGPYTVVGRVVGRVVMPISEIDIRQSIASALGVSTRVINGPGPNTSAILNLTFALRTTTFIDPYTLPVTEETRSVSNTQPNMPNALYGVQGYSVVNRRYETFNPSAVHEGDTIIPGEYQKGVLEMTVPNSIFWSLRLSSAGDPVFASLGSYVNGGTAAFSASGPLEPFVGGSASSTRTVREWQNGSVHDLAYDSHTVSTSGGEHELWTKDWRAVDILTGLVFAPTGEAYSRDAQHSRGTFAHGITWKRSMISNAEEWRVNGAVVYSSGVIPPDAPPSGFPYSPVVAHSAMNIVTTLNDSDAINGSVTILDAPAGYLASFLGIAGLDLWEAPPPGGIGAVLPREDGIGVCVARGGAGYEAARTDYLADPSAVKLAALKAQITYVVNDFATADMLAALGHDDRAYVI